MIRHGTAVPVGEGATSRVCKAWDQARGRMVAIKYLLHADPAARLRLLREAHAVAALDHPHLCPVLEVGQDEGRDCIVMPFLDGPTLENALPELDLEARVRVIAQICDAVHHAHEQGLLHRDLKPANIIVTRERGLPHAWVLDFGLVRRIGDAGITSTGEVLGTPAFMSPEQARGQSLLDRRSDVFSLGAVLYFVLAGRSPFAAASTAETLMRVIDEEPASPRSLTRELPKALESIVLTALEKSPSRRYASAAALAEDLRRYLAGAPPLVRRRWRDRVRRLARRHPLHLLAGLGLALLVLTVLPLSWYWSQRAAKDSQLARERAAATEIARQSLRLAYLRPIHDTGAETAAAALQAQVLIAAAANPAPRAQRQADLAAAATLLTDLGRIDDALAVHASTVLDDAPVRIQRDRAMLLLRAYRIALSEPQPFTDAALRARWRRHVEQRYRDPAQALIARVGADGGTDDWRFSAERDYLAGDVEGAVARLERGFSADPRHYDALLAAAEMRMASATERYWSGATAAAREAYAQADAMLVRALEHGRSDPRPHLRRCELAGLRLDLHEPERADDPFVAAADAPCAAALAVAPALADAQRLRSHLYSAQVRGMRRFGVALEPLLAEAVAAAERALALAPGDSRAARALALALVRQSVQQRWSGQAETAGIERAQVVLDAFGGQSEDGLPFDLDLVRGQVSTELAKVREHLGQDPSNPYRDAIGRLRMVSSRVPDADFLRLTLAKVISSYHYWLATQGRPDPDLVTEAISLQQTILAHDPARAEAWSALANSYWDLAMIHAWRGDDASAAIAASDRHHAEAISRAPDNLTYLFNRYNFELFVAHERLREGLDADDRLAAAKRLMQDMDARSKDDWITPCPRAGWYLARTEREARAGRLDAAAFGQASRLLAQTLAQRAQDHDCALRRVKLASATLPLLSAPRAADEWRTASELARRHPASLEMALAELALIHAALARGDIANASSADLATLLQRIRQATGMAWQARLAFAEAVEPAGR